MSIFIIKIIALVTMSIDHIASVIGDDGWMLIDSATSSMMRGIGRIAFPLFAFALVNGIIKTSDKIKYIERLSVLACLSQIPFVLASYPTNKWPLDEISTINLFYYPQGLNQLLYCGCVLLIILMFLRHKIRNPVIFVLAITISEFVLRLDGVQILDSGLNTIYTLICGMFLCMTIQIVKDKDECTIDKLLLLLSSLLLTYHIGTRSDYGIYGILLILSLYLLRNKHMMQAVLIILWSCIFYAIYMQNIRYALFASVSALPILLYDETPKPQIKYIFYLFYPLHLLILGILNVYIRFDL